MLNSSTVLVSFLVRIVTELGESSAGGATIALVNIDPARLYYLPSRLMAETSDHAFLLLDNINITAVQPPAVRSHIPLLIIELPADNLKHMENVLVLRNIFNYLCVTGRETRQFALIVSDTVRSADLALLARLFAMLDVLDVLYVIVRTNAITLVQFDNDANGYVQLSVNDSLERLFPNRFRGRSYTIAWFKEEPLAVRRDNKIIGVDVDMLNIIAKHQNIDLHDMSDQTLQGSKRFFDLATLRTIDKSDEWVHATALYFPNSYTWCVAVPRFYLLDLSGQLFRPFALDLWLLVLALAGAHAAYGKLLYPCLQRHHPAMGRLLNPQLKLLFRFLHFMMLETYIAMLTQQLEFSHLPLFPKTLQEFSRSSIPLLVMAMDLADIVHHIPRHAHQTVGWNRSLSYDPEQFAILVQCDIFERNIEQYTAMLGKRVHNTLFYLIPEPMLETPLVCLHKKDSRVHTLQRYIDRLKEAGVWQYLVSKWTYRPHSPQYSTQIEDPLARKYRILNDVMCSVFIQSVCFWMKHKISSTAKAPLARDSSVPKTELANHSITYHSAKKMSRSMHQH
uniref:Ionotropic glutamate receptor L-glutamate and glycine-binding domain-containing protein n=1 Tax=Anopheles merus TaxID=30066 RepID=A0A182VDT9_ANOME